MMNNPAMMAQAQQMLQQNPQMQQQVQQMMQNPQAMQQAMQMMQQMQAQQSRSLGSTAQLTEAHRRGPGGASSGRTRALRRFSAIFKRLGHISSK